MKFRFPTFFSVFVSACALLLAGGCKDDVLPETKPLLLTYELNELTIAPTGDDYSIPAPVYEGSVPSKFSITGISVDGQSYTDAGHFSIAADNGLISIANTADLGVGEYKISIACNSNQVRYEFPDIVTIDVIHLLKDVVKVEVGKPSVSKTEDLLTAEGDFAVATATFTEERPGASLSIAHILNGKDEAHGIAWFGLSSDNTIYIKHETAAEVEPETYEITLKVSKDGEDEGLVTPFSITVTAPPYDLVYEPNTLDAAEKGEPVSSNAPSVKGNQSGIEYSFAAIRKGEETVDVKNLPEGLLAINSETGVVTVAPDQTTGYAGEYSIDILVKNADCQEGIGFQTALTVVIAKYVEPISGFSYPENQKIGIGEKTTIKKADGFAGEEPTFAFKEGTDTKYTEAITIEANGDLTFKENNTLGGGTHSVTIVASNSNNSVEATFAFEIYDPNYFTYFSYGNNYEEQGITLTEEQEKAAEGISMFRFTTTAPNAKYQIKLTDLDENASVKWSVQNKSNVGSVSVDKATGELTVTELKTRADNQIALCFVTAETPTTTVSMPVFFYVPVELAAKDKFLSSNVSIEYIPFVHRVNPATGGQSLTPKLSGLDNWDNFKLDYRRTFNYYNLEGIPYEKEGNFTEGDNSLLNNLWLRDFGLNKPNKDPVAYYTLKNNVSQKVADLDKPLLYVNNDKGTGDYAVKVNPEKFKYDGEYADGVFYGQMTCTDGAEGEKTTNLNNGVQVFNLFVWIDKDYEPAN